VETSHPSTHFGYPSAPVTTSDGNGGTFTAVTAARTPAADMHGFLVFFWNNQKFIGWDSNQETMSTRKVVSAGTGAFAVTYSDYASEDPACCPSLPPVTITYHWNGTRLQPSQPVPPGVYGLNNPYAVPVTVRLQ
jgi:LppP/LprE lipoprotein